MFIKWVTSDYTPPPADAWPLTAEVVQQRTINADVPEAMRDLDPIERERMIEPGVAFGSGNIMKVDLGILKINAHRCIASRDLVLPDVDILALWCDRSVFICLWGAKVLDDLIREAAGSAGEQKRKISILRVSGANHFNVSSVVIPAFVPQLIFFHSITGSSQSRCYACLRRISEVYAPLLPLINS